MHEQIQNVAVIGATGAIGGALVTQLAGKDHVCVHSLSRGEQNFQNPNVTCLNLDIANEDSIREAAEACCRRDALDAVLLASGMLHNSDLFPEKSLRDLHLDSLLQLFTVNTFGPALIMKHFVPRLRRKGRTVFAALSARVGSIEDNRLGGWYGYRASKAALNMLIRTASLETRRTHPEAIVVGLHPGTVDSRLSAPFQANVPADRLFSAQYSAQRLLQVIDNLSVHDSGNLFAWDGQRIPF